jgi:bis(5'-nucleosyl)-tetraphosphatase (symmetrical)
MATCGRLVRFAMAVYAVGDIQGCYGALCRVLAQVSFDAQRDQLWLVGDLVNRGPQSLEVLRFVRSLGGAARLVLGNHEVHLLAVAAGVRRLRAGDTLGPILDAPDRQELLDWLACQPLMIEDPTLGYLMVHAGIPPQWDLAEARERAREAERLLLQGDLASLVGSVAKDPMHWSADMDPALRARMILAYFTRMRVCTADGRLDLAFKGEAEEAPAGFLPWFAHPGRKTRDARVIFGHWAALLGRAQAPNVFALDTGCAWGHSLTLMRLEDEQRFSCACG